MNAATWQRPEPSQFGRARTAGDDRSRHCTTDHQRAQQPHREAQKLGSRSEGRRGSALATLLQRAPTGLQLRSSSLCSCFPSPPGPWRRFGLVLPFAFPKKGWRNQWRGQLARSGSQLLHYCPQARGPWLALSPVPSSLQPSTRSASSQAPVPRVHGSRSVTESPLWPLVPVEASPVRQSASARTPPRAPPAAPDHSSSASAFCLGILSTRACRRPPDAGLTLAAYRYETLPAEFIVSSLAGPPCPLALYTSTS